MIRILTGDCRDVLTTLPAESVHCVVTSPPYWNLRDYGIPPTVWGGDPACKHVWGDVSRSTQRQRNGAKGGIHAGRATDKLADNVMLHPEIGVFCHCGAWRGAHGLEPTIDLYVRNAVEIFRAVRRVLRPDGVLWLNLGDSYASSGASGYQHLDELGEQYRGGGKKHSAQLCGRAPTSSGLKPKDLCGIPWRVAFALQADGWWLRQDIIWSKPNPMPESVTDRCTKAHEYLFLLTKSARYFFDAEAIKEAAEYGENRATFLGGTERLRKANICSGGLQPSDKGEDRSATSSRNKRSVWTVATSPFPEAHFATFPPELIEPCIKAGTSEKGCCAKCGAPWERITEIKRQATRPGNPIKADESRNDGGRADRTMAETTTLGWRPTCKCAPGSEVSGTGTSGWSGADSRPPVPCTVLDPFGGAGTTGLVADRLQRNAILIELNPTYAEMTEKRLRGDAGLFYEAAE